MNPSFEVLIWNGPFSSVSIFGAVFFAHAKLQLCPLSCGKNTDGSCLKSLGKSVEFKG